MRGRHLLNNQCNSSCRWELSGTLKQSWGDRPSLGGLWPQITQSTGCTLRVSHRPLSTVFTAHFASWK